MNFLSALSAASPALQPSIIPSVNVSIERRISDIMSFCPVLDARLLLCPRCTLFRPHNGSLLCKASLVIF